MKHLLRNAIACAIIVLPVSQLEARNYGGFKPGQTFNKKVSKVISAKTDLSGKTTRAAIPKTVPKLKKGQRIKFKIGKRGQLALPNRYKTQIKFESDGGNQNVYANRPTAKSTKIDTANVYKNAKGRPMNVVLGFVRITGTGLKMESRSVTYELK